MAADKIKTTTVFELAGPAESPEAVEAFAGIPTVLSHVNATMGTHLRMLRRKTRFLTAQAAPSSGTSWRDVVSSSCKLLGKSPCSASGFNTACWTAQ